MILQAVPSCKRSLAKQDHIWYDVFRIQFQKGVEGCAIPCKCVSEQAFPARALLFCAGALFCFAQSGVFVCLCGGRRARVLPFLRLCTDGCPSGPARVRFRLRAWHSAAGAAPQRRKAAGGMCAAPRRSLFCLPARCKSAPARQNTCVAKLAGPAPARRRALCKGGMPYGLNHNKGYFIFLPRCSGALIRTCFPLARFPLAAGPGRGKWAGQKHASAPALRRARARCRAHCHALRDSIVSI